MGSDKSELILRDGLTQKQRGTALLKSVCDEVFISTCEDTGEPNTIADAFGPIGPLGAIASAQKADPDSAWLILACDLPLLEKEQLEILIGNRSSSHDATYFSSASDGLDQSTTVKNITVSYFAQLRELTGTNSETLQTDTVTPAGLFEDIRAKYQLPLKRKGMMVAVNGDFTDWSHPLSDDEEVVFIPPVAGG